VAAVKHIPSGAAGDGIIAITALQGIVVATARDRVVAETAIDRIGRVGSLKTVRTVRAVLDRDRGFQRAVMIEAVACRKRLKDVRTVVCLRKCRHQLFGRKSRQCVLLERRRNRTSKRRRGNRSDLAVKNHHVRDCTVKEIMQARRRTAAIGG